MNKTTKVGSNEKAMKSNPVKKNNLFENRPDMVFDVPARNDEM